MFSDIDDDVSVTPPAQRQNSGNNWNNGQSSDRGSWSGNKGDGGSSGWKGGGGGRRPFQRDPNAPPVPLYRPYAISIVLGMNESLPSEVEQRITEVALKLDALKFTARLTGITPFEVELSKKLKYKEFFVPWNGFNDLKGIAAKHFDLEDVTKIYNPKYDEMKPVVQSLMKCRMAPLVGRGNNGPALFAIGWSKDGVEHESERTRDVGFFGTTLKVCHDLFMPVYNFQKEDAKTRVLNRYAADQYQNTEE
jgi:hypothetical protein